MPVCLVGLGSCLRDHLTEAALRALRAADVVAVTAGTEGDWRTVLASGTQVIDRVTCDDVTEQDRARDDLIALAVRGATVTIARAGDGISCPQALRDARAVRRAGIELHIAPGMQARAQGWEQWLHAHPLSGWRVLVPRMHGQAGATADLLRERGADPWVLPTIELHPPPDTAALEQALCVVSDADVVVFTSTNGVEQVFAVLDQMGRDARAFGSAKVAAIGEATARALHAHGIRADVTASQFRGEALAEAIVEALSPPAGKRALILRAAEAREVLPTMLRDAGMQVQVVAAYETRPPTGQGVAQLRQALEHGAVDAVLLTSSSTVRNLCSLLGDGYHAWLRSALLASIGPVTTETASGLGLDIRITAHPHTVAALVDALETWGRAPGNAE